MERLDFIRRLFRLYAKSTEKNIDLIRDYDLELSEEQHIDWEYMLKLVEKSELNSLPTPKYLKSLFPKCRIEVPGDYKYNDGFGILKLKTDFYEICMLYNTLTLEQIEQMYKNQHGNNFISFKYYPAGFTIIGRKIYEDVWNGDKFTLKLYETI